MCVTGSRGAVRPTRALMMSDTLSRRTSSSFRFESDAVRAHASTAPDHRFTYPHSPCGLLESCGSPRSESTCWTRSFFESEHSEPFYYRPEERPQAAAPSSSHCATQSMSASSCSTQHQQACACARAERPAVAAEDAGECGLRRVRPLWPRVRAHAASGRTWGPLGGARWSRTLAWGRWSFWPYLHDMPCSWFW